MSPPRRRGQPRPGTAGEVPAVDALDYAAEVRERLQGAPDLPGTLAAGFDAFEAIRLLARGNEDRDPSLFAAFMYAADAAIDGREALTLSPSLPPATYPRPPVLPTPAADLDDIGDTMASLAALLAAQLSGATAAAAVPADRAACAQAAEAARVIHQLMAVDDGDSSLR
jgi:hypothetical protein